LALVVLVDSLGGPQTLEVGLAVQSVLLMVVREDAAGKETNANGNESESDVVHERFLRKILSWSSTFVALARFIFDKRPQLGVRQAPPGLHPGHGSSALVTGD
jgi:hypothetical protein